MIYRSSSFVLRIWWEQTDAIEGQAVWRGWIQHVASGDAHYFQRLADLLAFIEAHTGALPDAQSIAQGGKL